MSPFLPHFEEDTNDIRWLNTGSGRTFSKISSLSKRLPGSPSSPSDPPSIGRTTTSNNGTATHPSGPGDGHGVWLKARPFKHLGAWAYLALGVIVLVVLLVLAYMAYSCCHTARLKAREERAKGWWRMSGAGGEAGNDLAASSSRDGTGAGAGAGKGGKGCGNTIEMREMMAIGKAPDGSAPFGRMRRESDIWMASTADDTIGERAKEGNSSGYKLFFLASESDRAEQEEWHEGLVRKHDLPSSNSIASKIALPDKDEWGSTTGPEKDIDHEHDIGDTLGYPPLAHTSERDSSIHLPFTPYYHLPTPIMRSGSRHSRPITMSPDNLSDYNIDREGRESGDWPGPGPAIRRGHPPKRKSGRRLTPDIPEPTTPSPVESQAFFHLPGSNRTPPPSYHYVLELPRAGPRKLW